MKCFGPCFGASKPRKHFRSPNTNPTGEVAQTHVAEGALEPAIQFIHQNTVVEEPIDCIAESKIEIEVPSDKSDEVTSTKEEQEKATREEETPEKKDTHEEDDKRLSYEESSESLFSLSIGSRKQVSAAEKAEIEVNSPCAVCTRKEKASEAFGSSPSVPEKGQHVSSILNPFEKEAKMEKTMILEEQPSRIANPNEESSAEEPINKLEENKEEKGKARGSNHPVPEYRYRDCSDEGYDDINLHDSDFDGTPHNEKRGEEDANVNRTWVQEESSESLFSLSTDSRKRISSTDKAENEVNSLPMPAPDTVHIITEEETQGRFPDVSSVLNPIENLTQGRVVKATVLQSLKNDKENINLAVQDVDIPITPEPSLKLSNSKASQRFKDKKQEIGVDTSLSSWLVESETTPISMDSNKSVGEHTPKGGRGSPWSHEDRPILGALTVEDIKKYSVSPSSRRTRSPSPDETPIIGTVGSYWSHTGKSMSSKFNNSGKDGRLKGISTTLKTRLDRAFEASVAET